MAGLSFCNEDIFRWGNQEERKGLPGQPSPFIRGLNEVERGFWANELAAFVSGLAGMSSTRHKLPQKCGVSRRAKAKAKAHLAARPLKCHISFGS